MKQECPTYLKTIRKSKAFAAMLSDTEPKDDFDKENDGILNAFTTNVNPTKGIVEDVDEEEELAEFKFEKIDEQDDINTAKRTSMCYHISPISPCVLSFLSLYACFSFNVCNLIFLFHTKMPLKCFRNTSYQSLLAINSLLEKFFKSFCEDRFYCIQQVSMS